MHTSQTPSFSSFCA